LSLSFAVTEHPQNKRTRKARRHSRLNFNLSLVLIIEIIEPIRDTMQCQLDSRTVNYDVTLLKALT
jgi:hypothetical protein